MNAACIEWTACKNPAGYGVVRHHGAARLAHRVAWERERGPIPAGLCVMHRCDNPACVNVEHLALGTVADNVRDMDVKGRRRSAPVRGQRHANAKVTDAEVEEIRALYASGEHSQTALGKRFGISQVQVGNIVRGEQRS